MHYYFLSCLKLYVLDKVFFSFLFFFLSNCHYQFITIILSRKKPDYLIWECHIIQRFLEQLHIMCVSKDIELPLSDATFIFGQSNMN